LLLRTKNRRRRTVGQQASCARPEPKPLADIERRTILAALEHTEGSKTQATALLGITRMKLHTRLKRFGRAK
jgi:DNA-binding NtrC family response regulator